jgi:hypothetical protein
MVWLKQGSPRRPRKNARNFTQEASQKRLDESLETFRRKNENALYLNSREAIIFKQTKMGLGRPCTCNKVEVLEDYTDSVGVNAYDVNSGMSNTSPSAPILAPQSSPMDGVKIQVSDDNFFGDTGLAERSIHHGDLPQNLELSDLLPTANKVYTLDQLNRSSIEDLDPAMQSIYEESIFSGSSINCGVCFKTGFQPGFKVPGHQYDIKTNYDIVDSSGFHVDVSSFPAQFQKQSDTGYVDFDVFIPLFFTECVYSVRDNITILPRTRVYEARPDSKRVPISKDYFYPFRGSTARIRVYADNFTHMSICFNLGMSPILVNLSEEGQSLDFEREATSGNITVVLPARVGYLNSGDVISIPDRSLVLKIIEAPRKQLANRSILEWSVATRTIQGSEALSSVYSGYKLK